MAVKRCDLSKAGSHPVSADLKWEADAVIVGGAVAGVSMAHALAALSQKQLWTPATTSYGMGRLA